MAENEFPFATPESNNNFAADIAKNSTILEEGPRICPLCSSMVRMYYVDFTSKIYMCSNSMCEYPFGDKYTIYYSDDEGAAENLGLEFLRAPRNKRYTRSSKSSKSTGISSLGTSSLGTNSVVSTSEWAEMNQSSQGYESDHDNDSMTSSKLFTKKSSQLQKVKRVKEQQDEQLIKQNVEMIKKCNKVLFEEYEDLETIRNEKWIKNLSSMQSSSGMKLLKDHELQKLKNSQENIQLGELKIDIASEKDAISSIVIEIGNPPAVNNKKSNKT